MRSCLNTEPNNNDLRINEMGNCINEEDKKGEGDEEFDISDSEFKEYKEAVHKLLKFRNYKVRAPNGEFVCPFCVGEEKQGYHRLLEHAVRVAEGSTGSAKQRANHSAMAKYLVIDLKAEKTILGLKDETHRNAFEEARSFLCIARDHSKRVLEQVEMLNFENEKQWLNSRKEELDKREVALTEEKRKMDDLVREKNDCDLKNNLAEERLTNDEILEAEKELMKGLENMPSHCCVKFGVKKRGEIDEKASMDACKKRHLLNEIETKAFELCYFWIKKRRDAKGNPKRLPMEKDVILRGIKNYWGNKIYNAVLEYITNGNGMELWNFEEDRKASHCEVIRHVFSHWKTLQCKRDELIEAIHSTSLSRTTSMAYNEEDESDESSENEGCPDPKADKWNAKVRKAKNDPMKSKLPPSAFDVFMESFLEINPNRKSIDALEKVGGDLWKSMSQAEKALYQGKAEKRKQEYEKFVIAYNKKQDSSSDEGSFSSLELEEDDPFSSLELEEDDTCSSEAYP